MSDFGWFLAVVVGGMALFMGGVLLTIRYVSHHYDTVRCDQWALATNRPTKFVDYHFWSWDCLTPDENGKWIPTDRVRDID